MHTNKRVPSKVVKMQFQHLLIIIKCATLSKNILSKNKHLPGAYVSIKHDPFCRLEAICDPKVLLVVKTYMSKRELMSSTAQQQQQERM